MKTEKTEVSALQYKNKLYGGLLLLLVGLLPLSYFSLASISAVNKERITLNETYARALTVINQLRYSQAKEEGLALRYTLTGDPVVYDELMQSRDLISTTFKSIEKIDPLTRPLVDEIIRLKNILITQTAPALDLRKHGSSLSAVHHYMELHGKAPNVALSQALDRLFQNEIVKFRMERQKIDADTSGLIHSLVFAVILTTLGFLGIVILLIRLAKIKYREENAQQRLHEQSEKISNTRQEIVEVVSHDLKNPLTAIELNLMLMQRQLAKVGAAAFHPEKMIAASLRGVTNMKDLISDLLDQAKLESGNFEVNYQLASLEETLWTVKEILDPLALEKMIEIEIKIDHQIPKFYFDSARMKQVLANILGNAIKFTPEGGRIDLEMSLKNNDVCVAISDSGPGMSPDEISHVFERFWQAKGTKKLGTGLGLSIANAIVKAHQGKLYVESEIGKGSKFIILLPKNLGVVDERKPDSQALSASP